MGSEAKKTIKIVEKEFVINNHDSLSGLKLLKYLDPYGDTFFNVLQMDDLISDLETLKKLGQNELIDKIFYLAQACKQGVHTYIGFYGD